MRCADCILECVGRSPLGGCPNGIIGKDKVPDTKELDAVRQLVFEEMRSVSLDLVDAVERYVSPKPGDAYCSRNEVLMAKSKLKKLLNDE